MAVSNYLLMIPTPYDPYTICFYSFGPGINFNGTKILGVIQGHYCAVINENNFTVSLNIYYMRIKYCGTGSTCPYSDPKYDIYILTKTQKLGRIDRG